LDEGGLLYRRRSSGIHQLVAPKYLVHDVIRKTIAPLTRPTLELRERMN
jgi:hypothetical protein